MKRTNYLLSLVIFILIIVVFWKVLLVALGLILLLILWMVIKTRGSIKVLKSNLEKQEDLEERPTFLPSEDVIEAEYQEKEIE